MEHSNLLLLQMKESGEFTRLKENPLHTYYTCVRYKNVELFTSSYSGIMGTELTYYGPSNWSCMKGWFEGYDNTFRGKHIDHKVFKYCRFRDTKSALKKDIGETFTMVHSDTM